MEGVESDSSLKAAVPGFTGGVAFFSVPVNVPESQLQVGTELANL